MNAYVEYAQIINDMPQERDLNKEIKRVDNSGKIIWVKSTIMPLLDKDAKEIAEVVVQCDITMKKELETLAVTDGLTKLYNRRFFNEVIEREIKRAQRDQSSLSFLMLDIDYFKQYNDSYGHCMGDEVLIKISNTILESIRRPGDYAFRLGGEEFGVLFSGCNVSDSLLIAEKIRKNIEDLNIEHSNSKISNKITVSIGLLTVDFSQESVDEQGFYTMTDDALYQAKRDGRNRVVVYKNDEVSFF
ncbi:GGDEF domain-containing protein [Sulfurimonas sp. NWX79]|uniref:GGDEF domain-containing protein n=1 Tax=Sulfurimonas sp. NWX79 TaxID=2925412 RepID=UPI003204C10E